MARNCYRNHIFFQLFGCLTCLTITSVHADGRVFLLESGNVTDWGSERTAQGTCSSQGARLASADELRHAVTECSFAACARGWLAGPSVGTIACSDVGGGHKAMKVMDVIVENATTFGRHMDVFCIKDKGDPCGDPPSFPHTSLQGHTGFEMGDELLYTCIPGYVMPNGRTAFSLLCDSCGVWYGLVQLCVKDETEAHIDYEDKFPDESHVSFKDPEEEEEEDHEGFPFGDSVELEHAEHGGVEQEDVAHGDLDYEGMEQDRAMHEAADSGVVHEGEPDKGLDYEGLEQGGVASDSVDYEGVRQQGVTHEEVGQEEVEQELGDKLEEEPDDVDVGLPTGEPQNETREGVGETTASTDDTWLDGYPITQEAEQDEDDGEKVGGGSTGAGEEEDEEEEAVRQATDSPKPRGDPPTRRFQLCSIRRRHANRGLTRPARRTTASSTRHHRRRRQFRRARFRHPGSRRRRGPHGSHGKPPRASTPSWTTCQAPRTRRTLPLPYQEHQESATPGRRTSSREPFRTTSAAERNLTHEGAGAKLLPTGEPCVGDACPSGVGKGPVIAIVIVAICALAMATAVAIWCYKKREQKSSVYKMNGKGQSRHPQQIEMQQKV
ncbi:hypothetical protein SKAU_G00404630 [Synaphobranchus kaupii]|uniref:Sushi domain-containing protein 5 n=1 Tax=Synaphobranchus kaupii TaxID=118154 RepID=A0A9Q1E9R5_SYNKA|nr:hypothetical protein SKAU_G00404630 [Synaphobranchus kaupii]